MSTTHFLNGAMQDGRFVTNYGPACDTNAALSESIGVPVSNSTKFRTTLQAEGLARTRSQAEERPCGPLACTDMGASVQDPPGGGGQGGPVPYEAGQTTAGWK